MRTLDHLVVFAPLFISACEPPQPPLPPAPADPTLVALDDDFVRRVREQRCFAALEAVTAVNPGLDDEAWATRLGAGDTTAVASDRVRLDDAAVEACAAALAADDCGAVEDLCLPLSRFFVGTLEDGDACGTAFDCQNVCVFTGGVCGVCAACASNFQCDDGEVCDAGICRAPLAAGETCVSGADQCGNDLVCDGQRCVARHAAGEPCDDGVCVDGLVCGPAATCAPPAEDGVACTIDAHCASGRCREGLCAPLPTTGACHLDRCGPGARCDDEGQCVPGALGDSCRDRRGCDAAHTCTDGLCRARLAPGEVCTAAFADECVDGAACNLNPTGGPFRCRSVRDRAALGERCEQALCDEGQCAAGREGEERCQALTFGLRRGDSCTPAALLTCSYPLMCEAASSTCADPTVVEIGEACDAERVCRDELLGARCDGGLCVPRGGEGDGCGFDRHRRDGLPDDGCDAATTLCDLSGVCVRADEGATCDFTCLPGLRCGDGECVEPATNASTCDDG